MPGSYRVAREGRAPGAGRDALVVLGSFLVLGILGGVLWAVLVTPAEFTRLADGGAMGEVDLGRQFGADGWFAVIGLVAGLVAGLVLTALRRRDPLLTGLLVVVGAAAAAAVMAVVGHLLGPGDPDAALAAAKLGAKVPEALDVGVGAHAGALDRDTLAVYLAWPFGALVGALFVLLGRAPEAGPTGDTGRPGADAAADDR